MIAWAALMPAATRAAAWDFAVDTATLACSAESGQFGVLALSAPVEDKREGVEWDMDEADNQLRLRLQGASPGFLTWPVIADHPSIEAWILPLHEGSYVPADDADWIAHLVERSPLNTTEGFSMPWIALDLNGCTLTYIFENQFNNEITFENQDGRLAARVRHEFKANWDDQEYPVTVILGDDTPLAPALAYREWLIERGEFVSMREKIEQTPRAERLLGAAHVYLWGSDLLAREDILDWKGFCRSLVSAEADSVGGRLFAALGDEARETVANLPAMDWPDNYTKGVIAADISRVVTEQEISTGEFVAEFPGLLRDPTTWGDGYSTKMLDAFQESGFERLWLGLDGWEGALRRPNVVARADELGYLMGTYDSYHSMHHPDANPNDTWPTAQFDLALWETGGVMRADGSHRSGFKGRGRNVSPLMAQPYVERRVDSIMDVVPLNSWFIDCDAFGEFFDDYNPLHPANQRDDMRARLERMAWIRDAHGLVIGSEGGSAYAASTIHFAHGMMTPVIGWGDSRLTERDSEYYLGTYYPPDGPRVFVQQVPLAPGHEKIHFDPRFRLPLYEAVFHDSVVATHQWGYHSLKFLDQVVTNSLLEMLYQVPPMYHMNLREFAEHRERMVAHDEFFGPLHRETGLLPLTEFEWLDDERLVQRARFGDVIEIVANFSASGWARGAGVIPPLTVVAHDLRTGEMRSFTPTP